MTTPDETVPAEPAVVPEEAAAQGEQQDAEAAAAAQLNAIRELATEIAKQAVLDFDPATIRKGTVTAIAAGAAPPTLSVQISGDTTATIAGVRYIDSYAPEAGDVVLIIKQGTDLVAIGEIAGQFSESDWTDASLAAGFSHNGNSGGNLRYRRIWDHGSWKIQWKGVVGRSSGTVVCTLPAGYRPANLRPTITARTAVGGANDVKIDFAVDGTVNLVGMGTTANAVSSHTHGVDITDNDHTHGVDITDNGHDHAIPESSHNHGSHSHVVNIDDNPHNHGGSTTLVGVTIDGNTNGETPNTSTHTHGGTDLTAVTINGTTDGTGVTINGDTGSGGGHSHDVDDPVWVSFNGIEYFLD